MGLLASRIFCLVPCIGALAHVRTSSTAGAYAVGFLGAPKQVNKLIAKDQEGIDTKAATVSLVGGRENVPASFGAQYRGQQARDVFPLPWTSPARSC